MFVVVPVKFDKRVGVNTLSNRNIESPSDSPEWISYTNSQNIENCIPLPSA